MSDVKRVFKILFSVVIIISLTVSAAVIGVSAASASISGEEDYKVGESFSITIRFNADAVLYAVEADVEYNAGVLRLDGVSGVSDTDYNDSGGKLKIVDDIFYADKPAKTSAYTLKFTAISTGSSPISVSLLGAGEGVSRASAYINILVTAPESQIKKGDVNGDGVVSTQDLGLLMQYLNGWDVKIRTDKADLNDDGIISTVDYGLLMQYLNGWNVPLA